ncbi:MAG: hypothetical protein LCI00_33460 [Chloroflexi bacterium]|nr:hypothetical protein [Chloroflexota bacterium]MCC6897075.1 hypothetical protein [Anaerolineae bacterium]
MTSIAQSPQEYFRLLLFTVVGQAFTAAGYTLEERPAQWAGGLFRFAKSIHFGSENGSPSPFMERGLGGEVALTAFIEYQLLAYTDTMWASRNPSRFRVTLTRTDQSAPRLPSTHPAFAQRDLGTLVVEDFKVAILPNADYWWVFSNTDELGKALAESGHLVIGFGMPWLSGELAPPSG